SPQHIQAIGPLINKAEKNTPPNVEFRVDVARGSINIWTKSESIEPNTRLLMRYGGTAETLATAVRSPPPLPVLALATKPKPKPPMHTPKPQLEPPTHIPSSTPITAAAAPALIDDLDGDVFDFDDAELAAHVLPPRSRVASPSPIPPHAAGAIAGGAAAKPLSLSQLSFRPPSLTSPRTLRSPPPLLPPLPSPLPSAPAPAPPAPLPTPSSSSSSASLPPPPHPPPPLNTHKRKTPSTPTAPSLPSTPLSQPPKRQRTLADITADVESDDTRFHSLESDWKESSLRVETLRNRREELAEAKRAADLKAADLKQQIDRLTQQLDDAQRTAHQLNTALASVNDELNTASQNETTAETEFKSFQQQWESDLSVEHRLLVQLAKKHLGCGASGVLVLPASASAASTPTPSL